MEQTQIEFGSWEFFKIVFEYIMTADEMIIARILLLMLIVIVPYIFIRKLIRNILVVKNIISDNKPTNHISFNDGKVYKELDKSYQKSLLKQGLLLTLPVSISLILVVILFLWTISDLIFGIDTTQSIINLVGLAGMLFAIYVIGNINQNWFLHQLITNKCRISIETVNYIKEDYSENLWVKTHSGNRYKRAIIQYIDTDYNTNIPTLYRSVDKDIVVGSEIFIIEMVNGKKYALSTL